MTRYKKSIIFGIVPIIILIIWVSAFYRINSRFPNAPECYYTKEAPAMLDGIEVTPLEKNIYTVEEFAKIYPDSNKYSNLTEEIRNGYRLIVFDVRFRNTTQAALKFSTVSFIAESWPSAYSNGSSPVDGGKTRILEPGEAIVLSLVTNMNDIGLIKTKYLENPEESQFNLVYSYYPEKKILKFE